MKEAGNPDSNPELYEGGWEPRTPRGRSKVYKEGSSPVEEGSSSVVLLVNRSLLSQS